MTKNRIGMAGPTCAVAVAPRSFSKTPRCEKELIVGTRSRLREAGSALSGDARVSFLRGHPMRSRDVLDEAVLRAAPELRLVSNRLGPSNPRLPRGSANP